MKKEWPFVPLNDVCEFLDRRGVTPEKLGSKFVSSGFRVISAKNVKGQKLDIDVGEQRFVDESTYRKWMKSPLLKDDVLLTSEAPLGEPAYIADDLEWCLGQRLFGIRTNKSRLFGRFLYYGFHSSVVRNDLMSWATGATAQGIRQAELKRVAMPVPPLPEQQRIVGILDEAFEGIARAKANAEKNLLNARALFESHLQSVFTQRGKGWEEKPLAELCDSSRVITYGVIKLGEEVPDGIPCLRTSNVRWLRIETDGMKRIAPALSSEYSRTILKGGEVLVNVRGTLGGVAVAAPEMAGWNVSREVAVVPVNSSRVNPTFLSYLIGSGTSQHWLGSVKKGAAYVGINIEDLRLLPVSAPALNKQLEVVRHLESLEEETQRLEAIYQQKLAALDEFKKSLLRQAFTGQL